MKTRPKHPRGPNRRTGSNFFAIEKTSRRRPIAGPLWWKNLSTLIQKLPIDVRAHTWSRKTFSEASHVVPIDRQGGIPRGPNRSSRRHPTWSQSIVKEASHPVPIDRQGGIPQGWTWWLVEFRETNPEFLIAILVIYWVSGNKLLNSGSHF